MIEILHGFIYQHPHSFIPSFIHSFIPLKQRWVTNILGIMVVKNVWGHAGSIPTVLPSLLQATLQLEPWLKLQRARADQDENPGPDVYELQSTFWITGPCADGQRVPKGVRPELTWIILTSGPEAYTWCLLWPAWSLGAVVSALSLMPAPADKVQQGFFHTCWILLPNTALAKCWGVSSPKRPTKHCQGRLRPTRDHQSLFLVKAVRGIGLKLPSASLCAEVVASGAVFLSCKMTGIARKSAYVTKIHDHAWAAKGVVCCCETRKGQNRNSSIVEALLPWHLHGSSLIGCGLRHSCLWQHAETLSKSRNQCFVCDSEVNVASRTEAFVRLIQLKWQKWNAGIAAKSCFSELWPSGACQHLADHPESLANLRPKKSASKWHIGSSVLYYVVLLSIFFRVVGFRAAPPDSRGPANVIWRYIRGIWYDGYVGKMGPYCQQSLRPFQWGWWDPRRDTYPRVTRPFWLSFDHGSCRDVLGRAPLQPFYRIRPLGLPEMLIRSILYPDGT